MKNLIFGCLFVMLAAVASARAQDPTGAQSAVPGEDKISIQAAPSALAAYTKWREATLPNFAQKDATPHYAVAIVAQRLDDSTAQVEMLIAAEMKHYVISIKPVTLNRLASGETESKSAGNAVTIDQKAGDKLGTGSDKIRFGQTTTTVRVGKAVQALEITWTPKNDNKEGFANTCIVRLGKEPEVIVNGYILGEPVR